jgi:hypothetical protein
VNDEQIFLANAYLDGILDAGERAAAAIDPAVMAEVDRLRGLQAELRAVEPARRQVREQALAAALGEFDRTYHRPPIAAPEAGHHPTIPLRRRPVYARWLPVAAAVLAIGLVGVVIATAGTGGDDEAAGDAAAPAATEAPAVADAGEAARTMEAIAPATELAAIDATATAAPAADMPEAGDAPAATEAPAATGSPEATLSASEMAPILDEATLAATGADLLAREADGSLGITPETTCGTDDSAPASVLAAGVYQLPEGLRPVWIAIDRVTDTVLALDLNTCQPVASAPLP